MENRSRKLISVWRAWNTEWTVGWRDDGEKVSERQRERERERESIGLSISISTASAWVFIESFHRTARLAVRQRMSRTKCVGHLDGQRTREHERTAENRPERERAQWLCGGATKRVTGANYKRQQPKRLCGVGRAREFYSLADHFSASFGADRQQTVR